MRQNQQNLQRISLQLWKRVRVERVYLYETLMQIRQCVLYSIQFK